MKFFRFLVDYMAFTTMGAIWGTLLHPDSTFMAWSHGYGFWIAFASMVSLAAMWAWGMSDD